MARGAIPVAKVYEDEAVLAFLDIAPISDGHTLVIPKEHCARIDECGPGVLGEVAARLGTVAKAVVLAVKADGCNVLSNNGVAAGQVVNHLHFHIIPRRAGDGLLGGWPSYRYKEGRLEELAAAIRENFE
jgi:histidine triad (HIT) family protein